MKQIPRRVFTAEYKSEAVKLSSAVGVPTAARQLDVDTKSLYLWIRQSNEGTLKPSGSSKLTIEQQRIRELERELAIARMERDLLKKRRRSSRRSRGEVRLDRETATPVQCAATMRFDGCLPEWLHELVEAANAAAHRATSR